MRALRLALVALFFATVAHAQVNMAPLGPLGGGSGGGGGTVNGPSGVFNLSSTNLAHWRGALARVRAGTGRGRLLMVGDSTTQGYSAQGGTSAVGDWPLSPVFRLATLLSGYSATPSSVANFFGDTNVSGAATTYAAYDVRFTMGANWSTDTTHNTIGGHWFPYATGAANNLTFTPTTALDTINVTYWKGGVGTFTFNVDGGSSLGTSIGGSTGWATLTATVTKGTHTINIVPGNNGSLFLGGIIAYDSTVPAIDVIQAGANGFKAADYVGTAQAFNAPATFPIVAPDLTVINLTINDVSAATDVTAYTASMQTLITAALGTGDVILVMGNPGPSNTASQLAPYQAALRSLALSNNLPMIDLTTRWVSFAVTNPIMPYGSGVHPTQVGYADIALAVFEALAMP